MPTDPVLGIAFYVLAAVTLVSAVLVVSLPNIFHAVLFLVLTFVGVAGLYITLNAPFLAAVQVLIYAGAIAVLTLFAIFMTRNAMAQGNPPGRLQAWAAFAAILMFAALGWVFFQTVWATGAPAGTLYTPSDLAQNLFTTYAFPFELASVLLLIAMIGAIALARD